MAKRYGRNQRRAHREKIAKLEAEIRGLRFQVGDLRDRAKPFDAMRLLTRHIAGQLGPQIEPYLQRMLASDERGSRLPLTFSEAVDVSETMVTTMRATFDLRAHVAL